MRTWSAFSGDAVTPADPNVPGTVLYRACDFGDGVTELAVTAVGQASWRSSPVRGRPSRPA
ncbi:MULTISPECIES: hypothetical protein [unclassified Streptomyces]|uniref:hypothetical protein n=1 Tax=unclassified Streptomyces TaxID=2593676 RepID=UPI00369C3382